MKSKLNKRNIIALLLLLIPVWLLGISNFLFSAASFTHRFEYDFDMGNNVFPNGVALRDSHIFVYPPDHTVAAIMIDMKNPVRDELSITVNYTMSNIPFDERNTRSVLLPAGSSEATIHLPAAYFTGITILGIDPDNELIEIEGIYLSKTAVGIRQWVGNYDGILMMLIMSVFITASWVALLLTNHLDGCIERFTERCAHLKRLIIEKPGKTVFLSSVILVTISLTVALDFLVQADTQTAGREILIKYSIRLVFLLIAGMSVYCIIVFRGEPEKQFLSLSLLIGFLFIATSPPFWYGADQQIRYAWAVEESFVRTVSVSRADWILSNSAEGSQVLIWELTPAQTYLPSARDNEILYTFVKGTETLSHMGMEFEGFRSLYVRFANIPAGLMIFIGRSLALSPILIIRLGMLGNHLVYTMLVYHALRRLSSGKYLLAVIAVFPTAFVLSTTYGYDWWLTAFTMLGFAYFFHEVQNPDKKIELKGIVIMIVAFFIGLGQKGVYIPLMLILYFMKKDKFKTQKGYHSYLAGLTVAALIVIATFALPYIASGGGGIGDYRGGEQVHAASQTMFILQNPIAFAKILVRYMMEFLVYTHTNPHYDFLQHYVTFFINLGPSSLVFVVWILLGFVTLTDRNEKDLLTSTLWNKALVTAIALVTVALFSTVMYIAFTAVGADTIAGVQGRYLMPLLFPFLYVVGGFKIKNLMNEQYYSIGVFSVMLGVILVGVWQKLIPLFAMW